MIKLFLDIETLPGDESAREQIAAEITPPAHLSRPESIERWEQEEKPAAVDKKFREMALQGHRGCILCIGYIREETDSPGPTEGVLTGDERAILSSFWELAEGVDLFIGYNILNFDFKFIWQRSVIHGVRPSRKLNFSRYRDDPVYDVMQEWAKWGMNLISLDALTRALGIPSPKGAVDGSKVYDYYKAGKAQEIYDYCLADVRATRAAYQRMNFL